MAEPQGRGDGLWRIDDHVPALRASDLDPSFLAAIGNVRYELDVSALGDRMDEQAMRGLWGGHEGARLVRGALRAGCDRRRRAPEAPRRIGLTTGCRCSCARRSRTAGTRRAHRRAAHRPVRDAVVRRAPEDPRIARAGRAARVLRTHGDPKLPLHAELLADEVRVLEISDRGTVGLGGPTDNTLETDPDQRTDFASLVFSVGAPITTKGGGGTFGFGKIATYAMSRARTVILFHSLPRRVDRRTGPEGAPHRLCDRGSFNMQGRKFTGRHWWGRMSGSIGPVEGRDAARAAKGIFASDFSDGSTGTSILVVQPDLGDLSHDEAVQRIVASVLWNAWPKMVPWPGSDEPPMRISVRSNGQPVPIPDPRSIRPFAGFAHALTEVRRRQSAGSAQPMSSSSWAPPEERPVGVLRQSVQSVDSQRPVRPRRPHRSRRDHASCDAGAHGRRRGAGVGRVGDHCHHLALMRGAELIVRYVPGPVHPNEADGVEWAAVFKCDPSHDELFARAEPPTHDNWRRGTSRRAMRSTIVNRGAKQGRTSSSVRCS
jgi:hypothetical protein